MQQKLIFSSVDIRVFFSNETIKKHLRHLTDSTCALPLSKGIDLTDFSASVSEDFLKILKKFNHKPILLLKTCFAQLARLADDKGEIALTNLSINKDHFNERYVIYTDEPVFEITVDLTHLDSSDLKALITQLNAIKTVYHLTLTGKFSLREADFLQFVEKLTQFVTISSESLAPNLQKPLEESAYRNLLRNHLQHHIDKESDVDPALIKAWSAIPNSSLPLSQLISYQKLFTSTVSEKTIEEYFIKQIFNEKIDSGLVSQLQPIEDCLMANLCVSGMGVRFFRLFLESLETSQTNEAVYLNHLLSAVEWEILLENLQRNALNITEWKIFIDAETVNSPYFSKFLAELNATPSIHLVLVVEEQDAYTTQSLLEIINQTKPSYFIQLASINPLTKNYPPEAISFTTLSKSELSKFEMLVQQIYQVLTEISRTNNWEKFNDNNSDKVFPFSSITLPSAMPALSDKNNAENNLFADEMILKTLIHLAPDSLINDRRAFDQFVNVQHQHTVKIQQQQAQQVQLQQQVQREQMIFKEPIYSEFLGDKVSFEDFLAPPYSSIYSELIPKDAIDLCLDEFKKAWFASLPFGIQYLSPAAALYIAENLPHLMNVNFLHFKCMGFCLKKQAGDTVLDYDPYQEKSSRNEFTPNVIAKRKKYANFYDGLHGLFLSQPEKATGIFDQILGLGNRLWPNAANKRHIQQAQVLLARYGEKGLCYFADAIQKMEKSQPELGSFFIEHYFNHFEDFTGFFTSEFFNQLDDILLYEEIKLKWLLKFLEGNGLSQHPLTDTIVAFEKFWSELSLLCQKNRVVLTDIPLNFQPPLGNPVVAMERLLIILKNARNFSEQVAQLDHLSLTHYGAFYASYYEGFKLVSDDMEFNYTYQNELHALPYTSFYLVILEDLYNFGCLHPAFLTGIFTPKKIKICPTKAIFLETLAADENVKEFYSYLVKDEEKIYFGNGAYSDPKLKLLSAQTHQIITQKFSDHFANDQLTEIQRDKDKENFSYIMSTIFSQQKTIHKLLYRYIGQQSHAISLPEFKQLLTDWKEGNGSIGSYDPSMHSVQFIFWLLLVSHERDNPEFREAKKLQWLFQHLLDVDNDDVLNNIIKNLILCYQQGIKLTIPEAEAICHFCIAMNSVEFQRFDLSKKAVTKRLFHELATNKYGMLKALQLISHQSIEVNRHYVKYLAVYLFAVLDQLKKDPSIQDKYQENLPLFATLIAASVKEDKGADQYFNEIIGYFSRASQETSSIFTLHFDYFLSRILQAKSYAKAKVLADAMKEISFLDKLDYQFVDQLLGKNNLLVAQKALSENFHYDNVDIKNAILRFIAKIDSFGSNKLNDYSQLTISELIGILNDRFAGNERLVFEHKEEFAPLFKQLRIALIAYHAHNFHVPALNFLVDTLSKCKDFSGSSFESVKQIITYCETIVNRINQLTDLESFPKIKEQFIELFQSLNFEQSEYTSELLIYILDKAYEMRYRNYLPIIEAIFRQIKPESTIKEQELCLLLNFVSELNSKTITDTELLILVKFYLNTLKEKSDLDSLHSVHQELMSLIDSPAKQLASRVIKLFESGMLDKQALSKLLMLLNRNQASLISIESDLLQLLTELEPHQLNHFLTTLDSVPDKSSDLLFIIAKSYAKASIPENHHYETIKQVIQKLQTLPKDRLAIIKEGYASLKFLLAMLDQYETQADKSLTTFLNATEILERAPFGPRNFEQQFDTSQVARVINGMTDPGNQNKILPYFLRKQLMEAFYFVNAIGYQLPMYPQIDKKEITFLTAEKLSDKDIKELLFKYQQAIKQEANPKKQQKLLLLALGLMREALYRRTRLFPNSTQIIKLICCILLSAKYARLAFNFDTGQGKSLTSAMESVLLWLQNNKGVDCLSPTLFNIKRDHQVYTAFFHLCGMPCANDIFTLNSSFQDYQLDGGNYSTPSERWFANQKNLTKKSQPIFQANSCVLTEPDAVLLDDSTIFRYAFEEGRIINAEDHWIYSEINRFIVSATFKKTNNDAKKNINLLRIHLERAAQKQGKSKDFVQQFDDKQLRIWIESSLMANYYYIEDIDYMIDPTPKVFEIDGNKEEVYLIHLLNKTDGRINTGAQLGRGQHQLLCEKLTRERKQKFYVSPETHLQLIGTSENLMTFYPDKLWVSSGTVTGSEEETKKWQEDYGFRFVKIPPHQAKQVEAAPVEILDDEAAQFARAMQILNNKPYQKSLLVFCQDIPTAKRFYTYLQAHLPFFWAPSHQLFTGIEDEAEILKRAAEPNVITITTPAIGRDTDIKYDRKKGMDQIQLFPTAPRATEQMDGRTSREGSPTHIYRIYHRDMLQGKTYEQFQRGLVEENTIGKDRQKILFNLLGVFNKRISEAKETLRKEVYKQFIKNYAEFNCWLEEEYNNFTLQFTKTKKDYELFVHMAVEKFNQEFISKIDNKFLDSGEVLNKIQEKIPTQTISHAHDQPVLAKNCVPAEIISYHFVPLIEQYQLVVGDVSSKDTGILDNLTNSKNTETILLDYFNFELNKISANKKYTNLEAAIYNIVKKLFNPDISSNERAFYQMLHRGGLLKLWQCEDASTTEKVKKTHELFIKKILSKEVQNFRNANWIRKWFRENNLFQRLLKDNYYPMMMQILLETDSNTDECITLIRDSVSALLDAYLETSWFILDKRIDEANATKQNVKNAKNLTEILAALSQSKITALQQDTQTNQQSFWRKIKPINSASSRLQNSLNLAIQLVTFFSPRHSEDKRSSSDPGKTLLSELITLNPLQNIPEIQAVLSQTGHITTRQMEAIKSALHNVSLNKDEKAIIKDIECCVEQTIRSLSGI